MASRFAPRPYAAAPDLRLGAAVAVVAILAVVARLVNDLSAPLSFDETFSAVIASQPSIGRWLDWCLHEIGGVLYYGLLWVWAGLFGSSNAALRVFGLLLALLAPVVIATQPFLDRRLRLTWAALLALWTPGFLLTVLARPYSLAFLVNTLELLACLVAMRAPSNRRVAVWAAASAAMVLTHYDAILILAFQLLAFLALHRAAALRYWPGAIGFAPALGWMSVHLPVLAHFSSAGAWYPLIGWRELLLAPTELLGSIAMGLLFFPVAIWSVITVVRRPVTERLDRADLAVALAALAAMLALILLGMVKSSFSWRYAELFAPGLMFALALWAQRMALRRPQLDVLLVGLFAATALGSAVQRVRDPGVDFRYTFNLEQPSMWLSDAGARRWGFVWDSPTGTMSDASRLADVAGFFPHQRFRENTLIDVFKMNTPERPLARVERAIREQRLDGLIWLSDAMVPGTRGHTDPPGLRQRGWTCRDFGGGTLSVLACHREPGATRTV